MNYIIDRIKVKLDKLSSYLSKNSRVTMCFSVVKISFGNVIFFVFDSGKIYHIYNIKKYWLPAGVSVKELFNIVNVGISYIFMQETP